MPVNNTRIVKNTLFLYSRQILIMLVGLYTSRVVLETLGVEDFGIFNLVGGIVLMLNVFSHTLASSIQRFFSFEIGRGDLDQLNKIFNLSLIIFGLLGFCILLLTETIGLWFVNNILTIPADRKIPALFVYQFSILSFLITIISCPFTAMIFAKEDMKIYSYISIAEVIFRLVIVFLLGFFSWDRLSLYSLLVLIVTIIIQLSYLIICKIKYKECEFSFYWKKSLFKEISSFSGWSLLGASSQLFKGQMINILLNQYFSAAIIAARAVASKTQNAAISLYSNFFLSMRPQLVKSYASNEKNEMLKLMFRSSKFSFFLLSILALPLIIEMPIILKLWLKNPPEYSVIFTRLVLIDSLIAVSFTVLNAVAEATGKIKLYSIISSLITILNLPLAWILLHLGKPSYFVLYTAIFTTIIGCITLMFLLKRLVDYSIIQYLKKVIIPILFITLLSIIIPIIINLYLEQGLLRLFLVIISCFLFICLTSFFIGLNKEEKVMLKIFIQKKFLKR